MSKENNQEFWSESLEGLENNPVFAMSLGSKELFHSNFLAFIFMYDSAENLRKWLYEKAVGKTGKRHAGIYFRLYPSLYLIIP